MRYDFMLYQCMHITIFKSKIKAFYYNCGTITLTTHHDPLSQSEEKLNLFWIIYSPPTTRLVFKLTNSIKATKLRHSPFASFITSSIAFEPTFVWSRFSNQNHIENLINISPLGVFHQIPFTFLNEFPRLESCLQTRTKLMRSNVLLLSTFGAHLSLTRLACWLRVHCNSVWWPMTTMTMTTANIPAGFVLVCNVTVK